MSTKRTPTERTTQMFVQFISRLAADNARFTPSHFDNEMTVGDAYRMIRAEREGRYRSNLNSPRVADLASHAATVLANLD